MPTFTQRFIHSAVFLAVLSIVFLIYYQGAHGAFLFDDTVNIIENTSIRIRSLDFSSLKHAAFSGDAGALGRPISVATFAINYYFTELDPFYFKLTNIVIHLLNGICILAFTYLILQANNLTRTNKLPPRALIVTSLAVASAWLLHPINLTSVLYIVQRMASLTTFFTLLGLTSYLYGRLGTSSGKLRWGWIMAAFLIFTPLAALSKENGILLPSMLCLIELIFFRFQTSVFNKRLLITIFAVTVVLPLIIMVAYVAKNPNWLLAAYRIRDFNLTERLMTEARVIWFYAQMIVAPDIKQLGIFHDDIPISRGLLEPVTTLFASGGLLLLVIGAIYYARRFPIAVFGILFFLLGHSLESSFLSLEIAHEHRNYLPGYGLLLPLFYYLLYPQSHLKSLRARRFIAILLIVAFGGITLLRSIQWGNPQQMHEMEVAHHPNSIRANIVMASYYGAIPPATQEQAQEYYRKAYEHYAQASSISTKDTLGLFGLIHLNGLHHFAIEDAWVSALAGRLQNNPFTANSGNSLINLERCLSTQDCNFQPEVLERIIQASLANPTLQGKAKAGVLFAWSDFLFRIKHNPDLAKTMAYKALESFPQEFEFQITLIKFLINMGYLDEAQQKIDQARQLDQLKIHTATLDELESWIKKFGHAKS